MTLQQQIEHLYQTEFSALDRTEAGKVFGEFKQLLNAGSIRAAEKIEGEWRAHHWVKKGILLGFRLGSLVDVSINDQFRFFDKDTFPLKKISLADGIRQVPGGSSIREGSFVARGVVCMPPMYINVGAYVDEGTMIDSHALVGSCAQIGKRVHLSAAAQIGGVLEPVGALPVIIEDDVFIGGNCGVYEGTIVRSGAVLGSGVILTAATQVFDVVHERILKKEAGHPLNIPENAVVVPGTRPMTQPWARSKNLQVSTPVIIKYRDGKTSASTVLEESLR